MEGAVITLIIKEIGEGALEKWKNRIKKNLSPKKMVQKAEKHAAHVGLLTIAENYIEGLRFNEPQSVKEYELIQKKIEEFEDIKNLSSKDLKNAILKVFELNTKESGQEESLRMFTAAYIDAYFDPVENVWPRIGDYYSIKAKYNDSPHIKNNFGFKRKEDFSKSVSNH